MHSRKRAGVPESLPLSEDIGQRRRQAKSRVTDVSAYIGRSDRNKTSEAPRSGTARPKDPSLPVSFEPVKAGDIEEQERAVKNKAKPVSDILHFFWSYSVVG